MGDLVAAAKKQYEYAKNEYLSGDEEKGDMHRAKAEAFIDRIASGEGAPAPTNVADAADEPLSADPEKALVQILTSLGFDPAATNAPAAILGAANPTQNAQLTLLGMFGTPDDQATFPDADFSLYTQYHEKIGGGSWAPKAGINAAWPEYAKTL